MQAEAFVPVQSLNSNEVNGNAWCPLLLLQMPELILHMLTSKSAIYQREISTNRHYQVSSEKKMEYRNMFLMTNKRMQMHWIIEYRLTYPLKYQGGVLKLFLAMCNKESLCYSGGSGRVIVGYYLESEQRIQWVNGGPQWSGRQWTLHTASLYHDRVNNDRRYHNGIEYLNEHFSLCVYFWCSKELHEHCIIIMRVFLCNRHGHSTAVQGNLL